MSIFENLILMSDLRMVFTGEDISNYDYKNVLVEKLSNVDDRMIVEEILDLKEAEDLDKIGNGI